MVDDAALPEPLAHSYRYLRSVRADGDPAVHRDALAAVDEADLASALDDDPSRLAFWLNVYNASVQDFLSRNPSLFDSKLRFFGTERLTVAGRDLSLNDVEHGLLRRSQFVLGGGYVPTPFPGDFERRFRVEELEPRIHFALNCGAVSCPGVAAYTPENLDETLDDVTRGYLERTVEYEPGGWLWDGVASIPRLFLWYRGDFGGKSGILAFLRQYDLLPDGVRPRLSHRPYDWSLKLGQYADAFEEGVRHDDGDEGNDA